MHYNGKKCYYVERKLFMRQTSTYATFRYFIIPTDQASIFDIASEKRQEAVQSFFRTLENDKKISCDIFSTKHILVFNKSINEHVYIYKFANQVDEIVYKESATDIENFIEHYCPFVYLIVDTKKQIILVELNSSVYRSVITTKNKLEKFFNNFFFTKGFTVSLKEITDENDFWTYIDSSDGIFEVSLKLNSPNLFGSKFNTNELLKLVQNTYNNTSATIKLSNDEPVLHIDKQDEKLSDALQYIAGGAGEWCIVGCFQGSKKRIKSNHSIKKVAIKNVDLAQTDNHQELKDEIIDAIMSVEKVMVDDNEEN